MEGRGAFGSVGFRQREIAANFQLPHCYDAAVLALSWERRRSAAIRSIAAGCLGELTCLMFRPRSDAIASLKAQHADELRAMGFNLRSVELGQSTSVEENFEKIERWLRDLYISRRRPLKLLLDITCVPKAYILFILGLGFAHEYTARLDCLYAGGLYNLDADTKEVPRTVAARRSLISEGEWRSHLIPFLTSTDFMPCVKDVVASIGGEISHSLAFIEKFEPGQMKLLFIKETAPGPDTAYPPGEMAALRSMLEAPNSQRTDVPLGDVLDTAEQALAFCRESKCTAVSALAIGAKSHALGLGLAAIAEPKLEVICRAPSGYKPLDVAPSGKVWFYEIEDRFEPTAFLQSR